MTIEQDLGRELVITWPDARDLIHEAKKKTEIRKIETDDDKEQVLEAAKEIFEAKPKEEQDKLKSKPRKAEEEYEKRERAREEREVEFQKNKGAFKGARKDGYCNFCFCCVEREREDE